MSAMDPRLSDLALRPFWYEDLPPAPEFLEPPPPRADVAIVGSGYTGLNCALETARGGRTTVVLEAGEPGCGCSTKNGGQVGTGIKPSLEDLARRYGRERARAIRAAGRESLEWLAQRLEGEGISCDFRRCGRIVAAHSPEHYGILAEEARRLAAEGEEVALVPRSEQRRELATDAYFGALLLPRHAALHPAKYHRGLLERAIAAGARIVARAPVTRIERDRGGFLLETPRGRLRAREVAIATNGYTGHLVPWLQRRVVPVESSMIATEELPPELVASLFPTGRVVSDRRRIVWYFRPSPDGKRILFGGRVSARAIAPIVAAGRLRARLCQLFPDLEPFRISHFWSGAVAWSFDELPHIGRHEGLWYALGYCGSGVALASWLGSRLGLQILGREEGETAFDGLPHPTRPFYSGTPWFLPAVVALYRFLDEYDRRRTMRRHST
ncbi:Gamma-glutamylputrescine oxidoreductase [bacterium HR40]|nr:Gamma-glutamylputrescine oxidoreductase [bacterium HR40]